MKKRIKAPLCIALATGGAAATKAWLRARRRISLSGRITLVTGGSRGLGLILARQLIEEGARVAICARDVDELERARIELEILAQEFPGSDVMAIPCDVTEQAQVEALLEMVRENWGEIEILFNNAGVLQAGPLETMTLEDYRASIETHFWAPLYTTLGVLPSMRARRFGRIVNISSIGGAIVAPHLVPYCAGKFALAGLSQGMRAELAPCGIFVTTALPFFMRLGSLYNAEMKGQYRKEFALGNLLNANPLSSMNGERAARLIIEACKNGDSLLMPSNRGQLALMLGQLFPGVLAELTSLAVRAAPKADGPESIGTRSAKGRDSTSAISPSPLTALNERAAHAHNELD